MSILVVEPDDAIRNSLRQWLMKNVPGWRISEATSEQEAIAVAQAQLPRLVLVDIADPETDGLETIRQIKGSAPQSAVVALVMYDEEGYLRDMASAGASASVLIWEVGSELLPVVRALLAGEVER